MQKDSDSKPSPARPAQRSSDTSSTAYRNLRKESYARPGMAANMRYSISQLEYDQIQSLAHRAISAPNKQAGSEIAGRISYICPDVCGAARNIIAEVANYSKSASGRVSNKERMSYFVDTSLYKLQDFIEK